MEAPGGAHRTSNRRRRRSRPRHRSRISARSRSSATRAISFCRRTRSICVASPYASPATASADTICVGPIAILSRASVGKKITLADDDSVVGALPFTLPFYSGATGALRQFRWEHHFVTERHREHRSRRGALSDRPAPHCACCSTISIRRRPAACSAGSTATRSSLTWCDVPEFDNSANRVNVQLRLGADGNLDFVYGSRCQSRRRRSSACRRASTGIFKAVDVSRAAVDADDRRQRGDGRTVLGRRRNSISSRWGESSTKPMATTSISS